MVGSHLGRNAPESARFALELVLGPHRRVVQFGRGRSFDDDLVADPGDRPERAIGVDQVVRVETEVHQLSPREQVASRLIAQHQDEHRQGDQDAVVPQGRGAHYRNVNRQDPAQGTVVKRRHRADNRDRIEPGEIPAEHQPALGHHDDHAGEIRNRLREGQANRRDQLRKVVAQHLDVVQPFGQIVEEPAQGIRHRLGLVVVVKAGQVPPTGVAAELDQSGAELHPKQQPAEHPDDDQGGSHHRGPEEDPEKPGFQQERLPAEAIERLPDVDDRQVERPEHEPDQHPHEQGRRVDQPDDDQDRQCDAEPG